MSSDTGTASFTFDSLDLEVTVGAETVTGAATFTFSGLTVHATAGKPSVALYDVDDTFIENLSNVNGIIFQRGVSIPGFLTCQVRSDDPGYLDLTAKRILKVSHYGRVQQAARIDSSTVELMRDGFTFRQFNQLPGYLNAVGDAVVYPEFELSRASSSQRTFGYMSKSGPWLDSGDFTAANGYRYTEETDVKKGQPPGLSFPDPWWIAKTSPHHNEAPGSRQYFRRVFDTTTANMAYQILATADNNLDLWLDGEEIFTPDAQGDLTWRFLAQITGNLPAGEHVMAAKVINGKYAAYNPMALIATLQQLLATGDVVDGPPVLNTNNLWQVSDVYPGFRRGDVIATLFAEAVARSVQAYSVLSLGFTHDRDSDGVPWGDTPNEYIFDVGSTLLDVITQLCEADLDVVLDPATLTVNAYNRYGTDKSATVTLGKNGADDITRLHSEQVDRTEAKFNTALYQISDGTWGEVNDSDSVDEYGRIETGLSLGSTNDAASAAAVAQGQIGENADTNYTFTIEVSNNTGPQPYRDWDIGDSVNVIDDVAEARKVRIMTLTSDFSADVEVHTPEVAWDPT